MFLTYDYKYRIHSLGFRRSKRDMRERLQEDDPARTHRVGFEGQRLFSANAGPPLINIIPAVIRL